MPNMLSTLNEHVRRLARPESRFASGSIADGKFMQSPY
jgi:hypothetical protein